MQIGCNSALATETFPIEIRRAVLSAETLLSNKSNESCSGKLRIFDRRVDHDQIVIILFGVRVGTNALLRTKVEVEICKRLSNRDDCRQSPSPAAPWISSPLEFPPVDCRVGRRSGWRPDHWAQGGSIKLSIKKYAGYNRYFSSVSLALGISGSSTNGN